MAIFEMPVRNDIAAYSFKIELDLVIYTLSFRYNKRMSSWIMDIADEQESPILMGIPVQTNVALINRFIDEQLPPGQFLCLDETGDQRSPDRDNFGLDIKLLYLDRSELQA